MSDRGSDSGMGIPGTLLFFGLPAALMALGVRLLVPLAESWGWPLIVSYPLFLWLPIVLLVVGVVAVQRHAEARAAGSRQRQAFGPRFRFRRLTRREWLVTGVGFLAVQAFELMLAPTRPWLARLRIAGEWQPFAPPPGTPDLFDPFFDLEGGLETFFGVPLEGNWWILAFWAGWLIVNIGGEELLWRGYALPLQERVFGRHAWLINGLSWNLLVHAFMPWSYLTLLPISLIVPYLVQRQQNTWIGVIIHGLGNLLVLALLIPGIVG